MTFKKFLIFLSCLIFFLFLFSSDTKAEVCLVDGNLIDCGQNHSCNCDQVDCGGGTICASCQCSQGNNQCANPGAWGINCPPGTVRGSTIVSTVCARATYCPGPGSAQQVGSCCRWVQPPAECTDWYSCPTFNKPDKLCRDCTQEEPYCTMGNVNTYNCVPICTTTNPASIEYADGLLTWTPGSGGTSQKLYVSANEAEVTNGCAGLSSPSCVVNQTNLSSNTSSYNLSGLVTPGTVYYASVVNASTTQGCDKTTSDMFISSCDFSSSSLDIVIGDSTTLTSNVFSSSEITQVTYGSSNTNVATVTSPDASYQYTSTLNTVDVGSATVTSNVYFGSEIACTGEIAVNVLTPDPWWQVMDGDVTSRGNLTSPVSQGNYFNIEGAGGFPGVPVYNGTFSTGFGSNSVVNWNANSQTLPNKVFDFSYFERLMPDNASINQITSSTIAGTNLESGGVPYQGYYWYLFDGTTGSTLGSDLTITGDTDLGTRKVILLVKGANLNLEGNINLDDGQGFFLSAVNGNIQVDPDVSFVASVNLEGLYLSDGFFNTGSLGEDLDAPLYVRGSIASYGGINLTRDLADDSSTPAEFIEYAPDQILLFPSALGYRKINWKEVNP